MRGANKDPRGPSSRHTRCDWYYHLPLKRPDEAADSESSQQPQATTAQDPRLGGAGDSPEEISSGGRRKWFRDTDSDYVKLAKRGGQPDLLRHFTPALQEASPGPSTAKEGHPPRGDGDDDDSKPRASTLPDYMVHKEFRSAQPASYEPKLGPFDFDVKSVWKRDAEEKERQLGRGMQGEGSPSDAREVRFPATAPQSMAAKEFHRSARPKNEPVNFSKLLSNGYGEEWFQQRDWGKNHPRPLPNAVMTSTQADNSLPNPEASQPASIQADNPPLPNAEASQPASTQTDHE